MSIKCQNIGPFTKCTEITSGVSGHVTISPHTFHTLLKTKKPLSGNFSVYNQLSGDDDTGYE